MLDIHDHTAKIKFISKINIKDPNFGDFKLQVLPFTHDGNAKITLPESFSMWNENVREMMSTVPVQKNATKFYITIDTKYFSADGFLRREGVHMDGNFCADPSFSPKCGWAGMKAISEIEKPDNSHISIPWIIPYNIVVPIGKYVSGSLGGTMVSSSFEGCNAYPGRYYGEVESGGCFRNMNDQINKELVIEKNKIYFMSSNCPHETLKIPRGNRRTFIRITFPHNYYNRCLLEGVA